MNQKYAFMLMLFLVLALSVTSTSAFGQSEGARSKTKTKLIVAVMVAPPYSMQEEDGRWSGITVDLWKEIARIIDVDYEFKEVDMKGLLSGLENGTIDVGATPLSVTAAREEKFDFTDAYFPSTGAVAVNADQQSNLFQLLRSIFQNWRFLAFICLIIVLMVAGAGVLWLLEHRGDSEHYSGKTRKAFGKSLFWSTEVLIGRALPKAIGWSTDPPMTFTGRLFGTIWMMLGIILTSLFTATAASILTAKELQGTIHSPDDLRHVIVGTVAPSTFYDYLKRNIGCSRVYKDPVEMLDGLAEHKCDAAVWDRLYLLYFARTRYLNKIVVLNFPLRQDFLAIPLKKGSDPTKSINRAMLHVIESNKWQGILSDYVGNNAIN
jgi:polar amino acid transport system substrate-binding protein